MVVIGGGFGGLQAVVKLRRAPVEVTLIDRRNFHLFQPLTYQVATGALTPGEIAYPLRAIFKRDPTSRCCWPRSPTSTSTRRLVHLRSVGEVPAPEPVAYDTLIVAGGSSYSYFGHDEWREFAAEVKSLESALTVRGRILSAFEAAETETDPERPAAWLTFAVVGAGPTGRGDGRPDRRARARHAAPGLRRGRSRERGRILLIEAADRVLTSFPPSLSAKGAAIARADRRDAACSARPWSGSTPSP